MRRGTLKILMVEDDPDDVELSRYELVRAGIACDVRQVDTEDAFVDALSNYQPDIVLGDFSLPTFDGMSALQIVQETTPSTPFLFVSGTMGEERAIKALKHGAYDYVLKSNLARLPSAVERALQEAHQNKIRRKMEQALQTERNLLSAIFDTTGALGMMLDKDGRIMRFNQAAERTTGYTLSQVQDKQFWDVFFPTEEIEPVRNHFLHWHLQTQPLQYQSRWMTAGGERREILWLTTFLQDDSGLAFNFICSGIDITQWRQAEDRVHRLSNYDVLTGLPNRSLLRDRLEQGITRVEREQRPGLIAVILIGVRGAIAVRESLGLKLSEEALVEAGRRLAELMQHDATLARFGDTSFAMVLHVPAQDQIAMAVQEIIDVLDLPYHVDDSEGVYLESNIGVTVYPNDGDNGDALLQAAEVAMHRAMDNVLERFQFYTPSLNSQVSYRLQMASQLRQAVQKNELILHYQPQISLESGKVVGIEALLRWQHPEKGMVSPLQFIPLAEETGLIVPIGEWVLRTACEQGKRWHDMGMHGLTMAVNLSAKQFALKNLASVVRKALDDSGLDSRCLELELTESASMETPEKSIEVMQSLKAMGIRLSIDDFGTGYSNLNYLKRFPVDQLKIDQSFVRDVTTDADDLAISKAVIALARSLHLEVLAEGVEEQGQHDVMKQSGCDKVQGYYFSRPLAVDDCTRFLLRYGKAD
ncbi:PAS domain S-box/diguanylate cyclase (GGDEF) domain-containing protein [Herbaspirillum sp. CF444]|uniref:EAL domain-containing protein n=1 Tax=Herbaspirillum sp. CF444 TaxID=1144319 RepID=UPI00027263E1|nr:EAL domain-containing protein [Herbaspirillum sp. CF444]EJL80708.1 PAS domain S-box/diguanylate cyclase (GGDEF) domain-containing protein [Herbaspirillum sp. CF444]